MIIEIAALGLSLLALLFAVYFWSRNKQSKLQFEASLVDLQRQVEGLRKQIMELHTGTIGMGRRIQLTEVAMQRIDDRQQEFTQQDPERKLYSRAAKMVELGADLDEVMSECELPKAEAELLISLRKGRS